MKELLFKEFVFQMRKQLAIPNKKRDYMFVTPYD